MRRGGCLGAGRDLGRVLTAGQVLARSSPGFNRGRPRRSVALLLLLLVWVLCCLGVSLLCLESRVCLRTLQSTFVFNISK